MMVSQRSSVRLALANKQKAPAKIDHDTWRIFIARTKLTSGHGDEEVWVRCHRVHAKKVGFTFHTGPGLDATEVKEEDVDPEALWDGLGDVLWLDRVYGLWASYFGPPKSKDEYKDAPFDPATKVAFPINPRRVVSGLPAESDKIRKDYRDKLVAMSDALQEMHAAISDALQQMNNRLNAIGN
jgi:hypothetical protein